MKRFQKENFIRDIVLGIVLALVIIIYSAIPVQAKNTKKDCITIDFANKKQFKKYVKVSKWIDLGTHQTFEDYTVTLPKSKAYNYKIKWYNTSGLEYKGDVVKSKKLVPFDKYRLWLSHSNKKKKATAEVAVCSYKKGTKLKIHSTYANYQDYGVQATIIIKIK